MKTIVSLSALFIFSSSIAQTSASRQFSMDAIYKEQDKMTAGFIGKPFPEFTAEYNGQTISNETLKGKTVLVDFWFVTCSPCMAEREGLKEVYDRLKNRKDFAFLSMTYENDKAIAETKKAHEMPYPILSIPYTEAAKLNLGGGYPTTILIDKEGIVRAIKMGKRKNEQTPTEYVLNEIFPELEKLINTAKP